jgi:hypothetical protein
LYLLVGDRRRAGCFQGWSHGQETVHGRALLIPGGQELDKILHLRNPLRRQGPNILKQTLRISHTATLIQRSLQTNEIPASYSPFDAR